MLGRDALIKASELSARTARLPPSLTINNLHLSYPRGTALSDVTLEITPAEVTAIIGPSGCGKSTLLRCMNRMNDTIEGCQYRGEILLGEEDILAPETDVTALRRRVGMVFQRPNPFPNRYMTTSLTALESEGYVGKGCSMKLLSAACDKLHCGTR